MDPNIHENFGNPFIKNIIDKLEEEIIKMKSKIEFFDVIYNRVKYLLGLQKYYANCNEDRNPSKYIYEENERNIEELEEMIIKLYTEFNVELKIMIEIEKKQEQIKKFKALDCSYFDEMLDLMNNMK